MSDFVKFVDNRKECFVLEYDKPLENKNQFGKLQYIYGIQQLPEGEKKFSATEKLHEKIQKLGASKGDSIYVTKIVDPEKNNGFAFFDVDMLENPATKKESVLDNEMHPSEKNFEEQFESNAVEQVDNSQGVNDGSNSKTNTIDLHELSVRVNKLEEIVSILWKEKMKKESDTNHKFTEDDIPF